VSAPVDPWRDSEAQGPAPKGTGPSFSNEAILHGPSRMLKKSASGVLASLRGSTYRSVRLTSSLAAALLDSLFEHPEVILASALYGKFQPYFGINRVFPQPARGAIRELCAFQEPLRPSQFTQCHSWHPTL
jgi:hypothetical protein